MSGDRDRCADELEQRVDSDEKAADKLIGAKELRVQRNDRTENPEAEQVDEHDEKQYPNDTASIHPRHGWLFIGLRSLLRCLLVGPHLRLV